MMNPTPRLRVWPTILFALTLAGCASTPRDDEKPQRGEVTYEKFDAADLDRSGKLTPAEAVSMPYLARHFGQIDADRDALVSWNETRNYLIAGPVKPLRDLQRRPVPNDSGY